MIRNVYEIRDEALKRDVFSVMNKMLSAPKARGADDVAILYVDGEDKDRVSAKMRELGEKLNRPGLIRDSGNTAAASALLVLGARRMFMKLDCGMCGSPSCAEAEKNGINCIFPAVDLGIALGSGAAQAASFGLDNRIMYTIGLAALDLGLFGDEDIRAAIGIPFQASSKNIFFDRKSQ